MSTRIAVLAHPVNPAHVREVKDARKTAAVLGSELLWVEIPVPSEIDTAFIEMKGAGANAPVVLGDPHRRLCRETGATANLWTSRACDRRRVDKLWGRTSGDSIRPAAVYVDKIFKGAKPADLPFEQPTKVELVVKLRSRNGYGPDVAAIGFGARR